ncbi:MAG: CvpA family protein [Firmicutes bacterium]|nr:CvpA family protein [Bacillota bacterium]
MNIFNLFGVIDVVIVIVVILFAVIGWKKGFLLKIVEMASGIFGLIASIILARPFSTVLNKWVGESIGLKINEYLLSRSDLFSDGLASTEVNFRAALEGMSLPQFMIDWIVDPLDFANMTTSIIDTIQPIILSLVLLVLSFIVLFFGSMIVFFILKILAKMVTSIPVIKQVDKIFGVLFGLVKIGALIFILLFILALLITIPAINNLIGEFLAVDMQLGTEQFRLSKWLYDNNLLKQIIDVFI